MSPFCSRFCWSFPGKTARALTRNDRKPSKSSKFEIMGRLLDEDEVSVLLLGPSVKPSPEGGESLLPLLLLLFELFTRSSPLPPTAPASRNDVKSKSMSKSIPAAWRAWNAANTCCFFFVVVDEDVVVLAEEFVEVDEDVVVDDDKEEEEERETVEAEDDVLAD